MSAAELRVGAVVIVRDAGDRYDGMVGVVETIDDRYAVLRWRADQAAEFPRTMFDFDVVRLEVVS